MIYHHITEEERYHIHRQVKLGWSQRQIALSLGRSPSSISRELRRNAGQRGYRPRQAHASAVERSSNSRNAARIPDATWNRIYPLLREDWSPEQVAGRLMTESILVSHETIYQRIYADKAEHGDLWRHLRCQKKRRKRYGSGRERRGQIRNRRSIEDRPLEVEMRARVGDWEGDTVVGAKHKGAIVSLAERVTQYVVLEKVKNREAGRVAEAVIVGLHPIGALVETITLDNGKEFSDHEVISDALKSNIYFAHPYSPQERGLNEQVNGLVRQYFPKGMSFDTITPAMLQRVQDKLNNRPRKSLGFRTPREAMIQAAKLEGVALRL